MATADQAALLSKQISDVLEIFEKNLLARAEWGSVNFNKGKLDLDRAKGILAYLKILPLEYLPDAAINGITQAINQLLPILNQIDGFNLSSGNPAQTRDNLLNQLHAQVDNFYVQSATWVPYLAYQKGDVSQNIEKLTRAVADANVLIAEAKSTLETRQKEVENIIIATREASASAGAAVFTKDFEDESTNLEAISVRWLFAAGTGGILTLIAALIVWVHAETSIDLSNSQIIQALAAKLVFLSMLISATLWCGRQYRALKHLQTLNRHRSLSLRTLKAFSAAASDEMTRNAVLMEATRAVFNAGNSGYLNTSGSSDDSTIQVIEIAKAIGSKQTA